MYPQITLRMAFWSLVKAIGAIKYIKEILLTEKEMLFLVLECQQCNLLVHCVQKEKLIVRIKAFSCRRDSRVAKRFSNSCSFLAA